MTSLTRGGSLPSTPVNVACRHVTPVARSAGFSHNTRTLDLYMKMASVGHLNRVTPRYAPSPLPCPLDQPHSQEQSTPVHGSLTPSSLLP